MMVNRLFHDARWVRVVFSLLVLSHLGLPAAWATQARLAWHVKSPDGHVDASPAVGDLDGDGYPDILAATTGGTLWALDGNGLEIWRHAVGGVFSCPPTLVPACEGKNGRALAVNNDGLVVCHDGVSGAQQWTYQLPGKVAWAASAIAAADLDGDGAMEFLVGDSENTLVCLDSSGAEVWRAQTDSGFVTSPVVADIDGDGALEILVGGSRVALVCLDRQGRALWRVEHPAANASHPIACDLDRDGRLELLVGTKKGLLAVDSVGRVLWESPTALEVDSAFSVGDVDDDDQPDIFVIDLGGTLTRLDSAGKEVWRGSVGKRARRSPALVDLDADGSMEIIAGSYAGAVYVFNAKGEEIQKIALQGECNATPTFVDLDGSGAPAFVIPESVGLLSAFLWPKPEGVVRASWPEYRGSSLRTGVAAPLVRVNASRCAVSAPVERLASFQKRLATGLAELDAIVAALAQRIPNLIETEMVSAHLALLRERKANFRRLEKGVAKLSSRALRQLDHKLAETLVGATTWRLLTGAAAKAERRAAAYAANPWAPFGGVDELREERTPPADLHVAAFRGEKESAAVNLAHFGDQMRTFRVTLSSPKGGIPPGVVSFHEAITVPTQMSNYQTDAIPTLNQGELITLPAWGMRQLWLKVDTSTLPPGNHVFSVRLRSLDLEPVEINVPLHVTVWPHKLPEKVHLRHCNWAYAEGSEFSDDIDAAVADLVEHRTNVIVATQNPPVLKFDEQGELIGSADYTAVDQFLQRYPPDTLFLFSGCDLVSGSASMGSEVWNRAYQEAMQRWVSHLASDGIGYENWAFYPVDEPGIHGGQGITRLMKWARAVKAADPMARMYTNPSSGVTMAQFKQLLPLIDVWCPVRHAYLQGDKSEMRLSMMRLREKPDCAPGERLALMLEDTETWTYDCMDKAKDMSPIGYYRAVAWNVWSRGMRGIGFWTWARGEDLWFFPAQTFYEYALVYPGKTPVASKRWEAVREGSEDYSMLWQLRARADEIEKAGRNLEAVKRARVILKDEAASIGAFNGLDGQSFFPGPGGAPQSRIQADLRQTRIDEVRKHIAETLSALEN